MLDYLIYLIPVAAIGFLLWSRRSASESDIKGCLARNAQIVDVRTRSEFKADHHPKSVNVPMDEMEQSLKKLDPNRPLLLCCDTGSRSGFAVSFYKKHGFTEVLNLGSYRRIASFLPR